MNAGSNRLKGLRYHASISLSTKSGVSRNIRQRDRQRTQSAFYSPIKIVGKGAFGVVYTAKAPNGQIVAVKKVLLDPRHINRELDIISKLEHPNCVVLRDHFRTTQRNDVYINLVMDYLPSSLYEFNMSYRRQRKYPPLLFVKLFAFQIFSGLDYLHSLGYTHRDIKPQNVLVDTETGIVKLCDFGSAKAIQKNEPSVSYIASRYYRAPELTMGCQYYDNSIDIWAAGCVVFEMLTAGRLAFPGETPEDQLPAIIRCLGPPTQADLDAINTDLTIEITSNATSSFRENLPNYTPIDIIELLESILVYNPKKRPTALQCMGHKCFDVLFEREIVLPSRQPIPQLVRVPR